MLASASPRRAALLRRIGVPFRVQPAAVDETRQPGETPAEQALRLARAKAAAVPADVPVLAADTLVTVDRGGRTEVFGKPAHQRAFVAMLGALSGRSHTVLTAVAIKHNGVERSTLVRAKVRLRTIAEREMAAYWASGEPQDKAGGYAIQGLGGVFVRCLRGSPSAVVGLPLAETQTLLASFGVDVWAASEAGETTPEPRRHAGDRP